MHFPQAIWLSYHNPHRIVAVKEKIRKPKDIPPKWLYLNLLLHFLINPSTLPTTLVKYKATKPVNIPKNM